MGILKLYGPGRSHNPRQRQIYKWLYISKMQSGAHCHCRSRFLCRGILPNRGYQLCLRELKFSSIKTIGSVADSWHSLDSFPHFTLSDVSCHVFTHCLHLIKRRFLSIDSLFRYFETTPLSAFFVCLQYHFVVK